MLADRLTFTHMPLRQYLVDRVRVIKDLRANYSKITKQKKICHSTVQIRAMFVLESAKRRFEQKRTPRLAETANDG